MNHLFIFFGVYIQTSWSGNEKVTFRSPQKTDKKSKEQHEGE